MNIRVAKYALKTKHYSNSISIEARVKTAAGIYNCEYHFFWTDVMKLFDVDISISLQLYPLERDKIKLRKIIREHDHEIWQRGRITS